MPLPDAAFDVVLCQMGLQFFGNKVAALREVRRVLAAGGRIALNVPGPTPPLFASLADALRGHIGRESAEFAQRVFSLHDAEELRTLMNGAALHEVSVRKASKTLRLPQPVDFLWQYVGSTPLAAAVAQADDAQRAAFERDVCARWQEFTVDGGLSLSLGVTTVTARR